MHTVDLLDEALVLAKRFGYDVRQVWLGGSGGGGCEVRGRKCLYLDLAVGADEQLDLVLDALRREPMVHCCSMPERLRQLLRLRKVACWEAHPTVGAVRKSYLRRPIQPVGAYVLLDRAGHAVADAEPSGHVVAQAAAAQAD